MSDSGTYALIGAAAMIGGVCRNTISLTVTMVEATGNLQYVLPIMLSLLAARYTGDFLTPGFYDQLVTQKQMPYLTETLQNLGIVNYYPITGYSVLCNLTTYFSC